MQLITAVYCCIVCRISLKHALKLSKKSSKKAQIIPKFPQKQTKNRPLEYIYIYIYINIYINISIKRENERIVGIFNFMHHNFFQSVAPKIQREIKISILSKPNVIWGFLAHFLPSQGVVRKICLSHYKPQLRGA